jgi:hypothetical protein
VLLLSLANRFSLSLSLFLSRPSFARSLARALSWFFACVSEREKPEAEEEEEEAALLLLMLLLLRWGSVESCGEREDVA